MSLDEAANETFPDWNFVFGTNEVASCSALVRLQ